MSLSTLAAVAALSAVFAAPGAAAPKYKITWLLGHQNLDYFEEAAASFKKAVETGSGGEIQVSIVNRDEDKTLAPETESTRIAAAVARGEAEMGHSFTDVLAPMDARLMAFGAPYLLRGYEHMEGVIEGPVGRGLLADLREKGVVGLSFTYSGGASGIATLDRPIRSPSDLKGLKVGVTGDAVSEAWLRGLGAIPVPIRHGREKILDLAFRGELDAVVITWRNFEQAKLADRFRYFSLPGSTYLVSVTYVNRDFYRALPKKYRDLLASASREAGAIERAKTVELNADARRSMEGKGVRAAALSAEGRAAFDAALAPVYASALEPLLGRKLLRALRAAPDRPLADVLPKDFARR